MKRCLNEIARTVAGKDTISGRKRDRIQNTIEHAIKKLQDFKTDDWEKLKEEISVFEAQLAHGYELQLDAQEANLWMLNADDNLQKLDTPFLTWVTNIITDRGDKSKIERSDLMLDYLRYWDGQVCGTDPMPSEDFQAKFLEDLSNGKDPLTNGFLKNLVKQPDEGLGDLPIFQLPGDKQIYFGESVQIWYIKNHAPKIRIAQFVDIIRHKSKKITSTMYREILAAPTPQKKLELKQSMDLFLSLLETGFEYATKTTIDHMSAYNSDLGKQIQAIYDEKTTLSSPAKGGVKEVHMGSALRPGPKGFPDNEDV